MGTAMNRTSTERKRDNQCDNRLTAAMIKLNEHNTQGYSSAGRATVSKTVGRGFEPFCPCHHLPDQC